GHHAGGLDLILDVLPEALPVTDVALKEVRYRRDVAGALRDVASRTNPGAQCGPQFLAYLLVGLAPLRSLQEVHLAVHGEVLHVEAPDLFAVGATTALATVDGLEVNGSGLGAAEPVADEMAVVVAAQAPRPAAWD